MAIDSYTKLITEIQAYLENDDLSDTRTKELIALAENTFDLELRTREMISIGSATDLPITGLIPLPTGFREVAYLSLVNGSESYEMSYMPQHLLRNLVAAQTTGLPRFYTLEDSNLRVIPTPDSADYDYILDAYLYLTPKLSDSQASNWLLAKAPQLYLFGSLVESAPFFEDDARMPVWQARYLQAKNSLHAVDRRGRYQPQSRTRAPATGIYEGRRTYPGYR